MQTDEKAVLSAAIFAIYALPDYVQSLPARLAIDAGIAAAAGFYIAQDEDIPEVAEDAPYLPHLALWAVAGVVVATCWWDHVSRHWLAAKLPVEKPHTLIGAAAAAFAWVSA